MEEKKIVAVALYGWDCRDTRYDKVKVFAWTTPAGEIIEWAEGGCKRDDDQLIALNMRFED